jgi:hypothetical protein
LPAPMDVDPGPAPAPGTPCIVGSCIFVSTTTQQWGTPDIMCVLSAPDAPPIDNNVLTINKSECIPSGNPNYYYSYTCSFVQHLCAASWEGTPQTCPSGGCTQ